MKVSTDDTTYDTVFSTVSGDTLILRVHFPALAFTPGASVRAPEMKLTGVVATHDWIDGIGRVTGFNPCSSDRAFRESRLLLGPAVQQVVQEFQLNPPTVTKFQDAHLRKMQTKKSAASASSSSQDTRGSNGSMAPPSYDTLLASNESNTSTYVPETYVPETAVRADLPPIPSDFPELNTMEREELESMLSDDVAFLSFCNNLPISQQLQLVAAEKSQETAELAQANLDQQGALQKLHEETTQLQAQLKGVVAECRDLESQQDALQEKPDAKILIRDLTKAKKMAMEKSEQMADDWLDKGPGCADTMHDFCQSFLEERKIHHLRAAKIQILKAQ
eukprot:CAMPEP_0172440356 /NCGR_PEP_ID=MMETSP1065-20121228/998_1 /TAXON_ID=265537 /ORGANISM="Amphiprora paludosa, Strain CCMP125" /LENGTH=333 /DNA_ID=CAMNT_0013189147 /DNA_START=282 /DNA_END=1283 /DNA_ORIENTATION=-